MPGGLHPPPSVIASWPTPNYVDPVTHGNTLTILCILFPAIGILLVTSRIYSRLFITKAPGLDDVLIVIALAFSIALSVLIIIGETDYHIDRHVWDIPISSMPGGRLNTWISEWCYLAGSSAIKISILLFYRRLSVTFSKAFVLAVWVGIVYQLIYFFTFIALLCLVCHPLPAYWLQFSLPWLAAGHTFKCLDPGESLSLPLSGAFSVVGDVYSTMLPLGLVYTLDLPRRQKIALYMLFALGFLVVGAGIARTIILNYVINETYDIQWALWRMWIWTLVEMYLAIFAASAPALKPFFRKFFIEPISDLRSGSERQRRYLQQHSETYSRDWQVGGSDGTTVCDGDLYSEMDAEKIGVAVPLDSHMEMNKYSQTRQEYNPSTTDSGFSIQQPPLVNQRINLQSGSGQTAIRNQSQTRITATGRGSSEWTLPPVRISDQDGLRQYRAEIEVLPPLPPSKEPLMNRESVGKQNPLQWHIKRPSTQISGSTIVAALGPSSQMQRQGSGDMTPNFARPISSLERTVSHGSVRAQQIKAKQIQVARAQEIVDESVGDGESEEGSSMDMRLDLESGIEDSEDDEAERERRTNEYRERSQQEEGSGSSQETLRLPRRGSRDDLKGKTGRLGVGYGEYKGKEVF